MDDSNIREPMYMRAHFTNNGVAMLIPCSSLTKGLGSFEVPNYKIVSCDDFGQRTTFRATNSIPDLLSYAASSLNVNDKQNSTFDPKNLRKLVVYVSPDYSLEISPEDYEGQQSYSVKDAIKLNNKIITKENSLNLKGNDLQKIINSAIINLRNN